MSEKLKIEYVDIEKLRPSAYNPRTWDTEQEKQLMASIKSYGFVDPVIANSYPKRKEILVGGHFRWAVAKKLGIKRIPVVYLNIPDLEREKALNIRLNKNTGSFDLEALAKFSEEFLSNVGFSSEELDEVFEIPENPETFDISKELAKLDIKKVTVRKGDVYQIGDSKIMCGDSTIEADVLKLMDGQKADMVMTDPPYRLDYARGKKKHGTATTGFGYKRDRRYLETDVIPPDFTQKWMANVAKVQKPDFSIICYENWRNLREVWNEAEKYWKVRNMIVWNLPNRNQGYAGKHRFFSKHDIAVVATSQTRKSLNLASEGELLDNEYRTALFAISGSPHWEGYEKGKKYAPTDFITYHAADEKSSGQGIIFGTKPLPILVPYIKVLTKRGDLVFEPFGGSGSTLAASLTLHRRCNVMEKSTIYTAVILKRIERLTGLGAERIDYA